VWVSHHENSLAGSTVPAQANPAEIGSAQAPKP
jgi:hypothetical protein